MLPTAAETCQRTANGPAADRPEEYFQLCFFELLQVQQRAPQMFPWAKWSLSGEYVDDGTIFGNLELLEVLLARLDQTLPRNGLELNLRR